MNKFSHRGSEKKKLVTRLFNDIARRYDFLNHFFSFGIDYYWRSRLVKSISPKKDYVVLDVATGTADVAFKLAPRTKQVTGIDIASNMIDLANKKKDKKRAVNTDFLVGDAENLPFEDSEFDLIWSWGVIHHSPNTIKCAQEIERILKINGELRIMLYHSNSFYNWINVIFRYGILQGKLLKMSIQDLHNRYTDGKKEDGSPLAKYYSRKEIKNSLFPNLDISSQTTFEQKNVISSFFPKKYRRKIESYIPDRIYNFIWSYFGFLIFTIAKKNK